MTRGCRAIPWSAEAVVSSVPRLKVFRTPIGFHDAYVAAPSQKAALTAWGADANLFARGVADQVSDPKLMTEPLEKPGQVITRVRGTTAEHLAALPRERARKPVSEKPARAQGAARKSHPTPRPKPRPSRARLDALEKEMAALEARQAREMRTLDVEQARLQRRKASIQRGHETGHVALQRKFDRAKRELERALEKWRAE